MMYVSQPHPHSLLKGALIHLKYQITTEKKTIQVRHDLRFSYCWIEGSLVVVSRMKMKQQDKKHL